MELALAFVTLALLWALLPGLRRAAGAAAVLVAAGAAFAWASQHASAWWLVMLPLLLLWLDRDAGEDARRIAAGEPPLIVKR